MTLAPKDPYRSRIGVLFVITSVLTGALLVRAARIQLFPDQRLAQLARRQFQSRLLVQPRRGTILDRSGEPLAINREVHSLAANPSKVRNPRSLARILARVTGVPVSKIQSRLREKREFVWIKRHLSETEFSRLRNAKVIDTEGYGVDGLWLVRENQRVYPHGELAAHVLGDVNLDLDGMEGVELWMDSRLHGTVARVNAVKDALGRSSFMDSEAAKGIKDGDPVTLTLDASLQFEVERELKAAVARFGAKSGTVIVMSAVDGEILAMANEPSFDPNSHSAAPERRRNRAMTDGYEPGSTLKPVLLASALSHGAKLSDAIWGERGRWQVQGRTISEAESHEKHEWLSLKKIIQVSSNVGAAKLAIKVGSDHYGETLRGFGFGARSNSGFPGEISGRLPAQGRWQPLTTANVGFGQGILVTPIQMVRAYAAFLNGGWLVQPTLIKVPSELLPKEAPRRVITQRVAADVVEALQSVTQEGGTGLKAALEGYDVAGKTGTAQVVDAKTGRYSRQNYIATFVGFATGVEPRIVVYTSLHDPKGVYYASETAAPLFREVLAAVANRFSLPPRIHAVAQKSAHERPIHVTQAVPLPPQVASGSEWVREWSNLGSPQWRMINLVGLTPREALQKMGGKEFKVQMHGSGMVRSQSPEPGRPIADGGLVQLHLAEP